MKKFLLATMALTAGYGAGGLLPVHGTAMAPALRTFGPAATSAPAAATACGISENR